MSKSGLWIALTLLLVPAATCHGSDCQPVTCTVIQGLGQASDRAVIEGWMSVPPREKQNCSDTFFRANTWKFTHLKNSHVQLMSFPRPSQEPTAALIIIRSSMKALRGHGQGGLWRSTYWHDLHIDGKGEDDDSNGVSCGKSSAPTLTSSSNNFCTLGFF